MNLMAFKSPAANIVCAYSIGYAFVTQRAGVFLVAWAGALMRMAAPGRWACLAVCLSIVPPSVSWATTLPFGPGEKLTYVLKWGNIPAGETRMEIGPIETINGVNAFHFVMKTQTKGFVNIFFKLKERVDAYTDTDLAKSLAFRKKQTEGEHKRDEHIDFDWTAGTAQRTKFGKKSKPVKLEPGSLDPLSIFYYTRVALSNQNQSMERHVTDGKRIFKGRAKILRRETIALSDGSTYDTFCVEPNLGNIGGVFQGDKDASLYIWLTADAHRIPVRFKSKLAVGHFIGELTAAEGLRQQ